MKSAVRGIKESQDIVSGIAKAILYPLINASAGIVGAWISTTTPPLKKKKNHSFSFRLCLVKMQNQVPLSLQHFKLQGLFTSKILGLLDFFKASFTKERKERIWGH